MSVYDNKVGWITGEAGSSGNTVWRYFPDTDIRIFSRDEMKQVLMKPDMIREALKRRGSPGSQPEY